VDARSPERLMSTALTGAVTALFRELVVRELTPVR
jgi:hypothetical protein